MYEYFAHVYDEFMQNIPAAEWADYAEKLWKHHGLKPGLVLDLCCGSGAIGIEALSRGAKHAYFVEKNRKAIECIKLNVLKCKFEDRATIISRSASDALYEIHSKADIIFMDPPYDLMEEENIMKQLLTSKILHEDTIIIIEAAMERDLRGIEELGYELYKEKFYKSNKHVFFRLKNDSNL